MFEVWICFFYGGLVGFEIYVLRIGFFVCDFRQVLKKVAFLGKKMGNDHSIACYQKNSK
jgi:hypothetical protein